jgi:hypothetical protein
MSRRVVEAGSGSGAALLALLLGLAACEPLPEPHPRIVAVAPTGTVPASAARAELQASEPLDAAALRAGPALALCLEADLAAVKKRAAERAPLAPPLPVLAARLSFEDGDRRVVITPTAPAVPGARYAAVLAAGVRAADGRTVLDLEGRERPVVVVFEVERAPAAGGGGSPGELPPAAPVRAAVVEVLADAETPEAGGEFVEVANLGEDPLDLTGFRLAKRGPTGALTRCSIAASGASHEGGPVAPGGRAVVAGGAWDGRFPLARGTPRYVCGGAAVLGGLANDRAPAILLEDPAGGVASTLGVEAAAPRCVGSPVVRLDPAGPDAASNLACADRPTPGG